MQKSRNHIILIEPVPGGKGEGVDPAKVAVRRAPDELFDRAHRLRLCRLSQSLEEILVSLESFMDDRIDHRNPGYRVARKTESKLRNSKNPGH